MRWRPIWAGAPRHAAGFFRDGRGERRHRDAKIFTIFEGTSEIQRMLNGRAVTGLEVR